MCFYKPLVSKMHWQKECCKEGKREKANDGGGEAIRVGKTCAGRLTPAKYMDAAARGETSGAATVAVTMERGSARSAGIGVRSKDIVSAPVLYPKCRAHPSKGDGTKHCARNTNPKSTTVVLSMRIWENF